MCCTTMKRKGSVKGLKQGNKPKGEFIGCKPVSLTKFVGGGFRNKQTSEHQLVPLHTSEIGADVIGRSYVQFTGTASLNPKYLSAVDIRTKTEDFPHLCYGCRSNARTYNEGDAVDLYDSIHVNQESHYAGDSTNNDVLIKKEDDVIYIRSTNTGKTYASRGKNSKPRRVGGGFVFYETEDNRRNTSVPKWVGKVDSVSSDRVAIEVNKLQEPDGPVYAPTIPREPRSPVPKLIRDRQLHGPDFAKSSIYEILQRQQEIENEEARMKAEEQRKALEEARRKAEEEERRKAAEEEKLRKEELRKKLYKPPKPFKLKENITKTTVSTDPFSKNRSYNIGQGKDIEIKKSVKPTTQPREFKRRESDWKEPKKFEIKKDISKNTTDFWEPPKKVEKVKPSAKKPNIKPAPPKDPTPTSPSASPFHSPSPSPSPSPVEVVIGKETEEEKEEPKEVVTPQPVTQTPSLPPQPPPIAKNHEDAVSKTLPEPVELVPEPEVQDGIQIQESQESERSSISSPVAESSHALSLPSSPSPQLLPTDPFIEYDLRSEPPNEPSTPSPQKESSPTPVKGSTEIPTRESPQPPEKQSTPPQKPQTPKLPPLPKVENPNLNKLKQKKRHEPKKTRKLIKPKTTVTNKKEIIELPVLQPNVPPSASPEPEPPPPSPTPEPLVLPPLPASPETKQQIEKTPPPRTPSPKPEPSPVTIKRDPIIWKRKFKKMKVKRRRPKHNISVGSPVSIVTDPLDYLAKYCIVHKNRIGFYERVFSNRSMNEEYDDDEDEWDDYFNATEDITQPSFASLKSIGDEFKQTFNRSKNSLGVDEYISPTDIEFENTNNRMMSPTSDLGLESFTSEHEAKEDSMQIQERLDKLNFILDNVYSKIEKLHAQIFENEEKYDAFVKELARSEYQKAMVEQVESLKSNKAESKKNKKAKRKKAKPQSDNNGSIVTVGASPTVTPRDTPRESKFIDSSLLTDEEIVARTSSATMRTIECDSRIREIKLAQTRAQEKLGDMEKWLSELTAESLSLVEQYNEQIKQEDLKRATANTEFRRAQSGLYKKMNPLEEHEVKMSDMEPMLQQINGKLITKKECQYVYHVLNLPQRHKLNFKLFTVVAALSEKVSRLEPFVKKMINKMNFEALDVKMQRAKELFQLLEDESDETYPGEVTLDSLAVDLRAGGLSQENVQFVVNKFGREGNGIVDFLDYLTYLPLFIDIHGNIISDPLNQGIHNI